MATETSVSQPHVATLADPLGGGGYKDVYSNKRRIPAGQVKRSHASSKIDIIVFFRYYDLKILEQAKQGITRTLDL